MSDPGGLTGIGERPLGGVEGLEGEPWWVRTEKRGCGAEPDLGEVLGVPRSWVCFGSSRGHWGCPVVAMPE